MNRCLVAFVPAPASVGNRLIVLIGNFNSKTYVVCASFVRASCKELVREWYCGTTATSTTGWWSDQSILMPPDRYSFIIILTILPLKSMRSPSRIKRGAFARHHQFFLGNDRWLQDQMPVLWYVPVSSTSRKWEIPVQERERTLPPASVSIREKESCFIQLVRGRNCVQGFLTCSPSTYISSSLIISLLLKAFRHHSGVERTGIHLYARHFSSLLPQWSFRTCRYATCIPGQMLPVVRKQSLFQQLIVLFVVIIVFKSFWYFCNDCNGPETVIIIPHIAKSWNAGQMWSVYSSAWFELNRAEASYMLVSISQPPYHLCHEIFTVHFSWLPGNVLSRHVL